MRDLRGWLVGRGGSWMGGGGTARKLGQWCYSDLASSLASSGAASTCRTEGTEPGQETKTLHPLCVCVFGGGWCSPRWSWPRRSQSGSPRLPLPRRSPLPSWSSCPPSYRSQPFLSAGGRKQRCRLLCGGEESTSGAGVSYLCGLLGLWFRLGLGRSLPQQQKQICTSASNNQLFPFSPFNYSYYLNK